MFQPVEYYWSALSPAHHIQILALSSEGKIELCKFKHIMHFIKIIQKLKFYMQA